MDDFKVIESFKFKVGDKVVFGRSQGEKTLGEVVKVNRTRLKIKQLESRGTHAIGAQWVVPFHLCRPVGPVSAGLIVSDTPQPPQPARNRAVVMADIRNIYSSLSPENLSCDGELSRSATFRRRIALEARLRACFKELGREVDESEAYAG